MKKIIPLVFAIILSVNLQGQVKTVKILGEKATVGTYKSISPMYPELKAYMSEIIQDFDLIPEKRKMALQEIANYISEKRDAGQTAHLIFICTHNSRRSHMSQIWASIAVSYYGKGTGVYIYSGGTESTAFNPRAVAAMERAGFHTKNPGGDNPHYEISYSDNADPMICFSKKYNHSVNKAKSFAAIMVCSDADKNCPVIPGTEARFAIPYTDPKVSDDTSDEEATYDLRCREIATEMAYMMSNVN